MFKAINEVELQLVQIEIARAVLSEAGRYHEKKVIPDSAEAYLLAINSERVLNLIVATDQILAEIEPNLQKIADDLMEEHKK